MKRSFVVQIFSLTSSTHRNFKSIPVFCNSEPENCHESPPLNKMNNYSLVIDISSDEENTKTSTPLKSLPLNMIGSLSDSSIEVNCESDAELDSTFESPQKSGLTPRKMKKLGKVTFNLPPTRNPVSDSDDYYEEPHIPQKQPPLKPSRKVNIPQELLNDLNEPSSIGSMEKSAREHH